LVPDVLESNQGLYRLRW